MLLKASTIDYFAKEGKNLKIVRSQRKLIENGEVSSAPSTENLQKPADIFSLVGKEDDSKNVAKPTLPPNSSSTVKKPSNNSKIKEKLPSIPSQKHTARSHTDPLASSRTGDGTKKASALVSLPRIKTDSDASSGSAKGKPALSNAANKWLLAERRLTVSVSFPKILAAHKQERELEEERGEKEVFRKFVDNLPQIQAQLTDHQQIDAFWEFFADMDEQQDHAEDKGRISDRGNAIGLEQMEKNLDRFLRFCKVHASFEHQRQVFYSMCSRQMVKLRQLQLLKLERDAYEEKANFVEKLLLDNQKQKPPIEQKDVKTCFEELVERYANKSFQLCLLKSRLHFLETKHQLEMKRKDQKNNPERMQSLNWELNREKRYIACLELEVLKFSGK